MERGAEQVAVDRVEEIAPTDLGEASGDPVAPLGELGSLGVVAPVVPADLDVAGALRPLLDERTRDQVDLGVVRRLGDPVAGGRDPPGRLDADVVAALVELVQEAASLLTVVGRVLPEDHVLSVRPDRRTDGVVDRCDRVGQHGPEAVGQLWFGHLDHERGSE